jgi:hypothetical protein
MQVIHNCDGHELTSRLAHDWRTNFIAQANLAGLKPAELEWRYIADSWERLRARKEVPA